MGNRFRIAILGIGGVGGYLGAKLAAKYDGSTEVEINFITRGKNLETILADGLTVSDTGLEITASPFSAVAADEARGIFDLVICCVKSYDLDESLEQIKSCINQSTLILPFLNGVDASEIIEKLFPSVTVLTGCCYIVARLEAPGRISVTGTLRQFYIGSTELSQEELEFIAGIFTKAGVDLRVNQNIVETVWEKFLFISPFATLTSAYNLSLGAILANGVHKNILLTLMAELKRVAEHKGVVFPTDILDTLFHKYSIIPYEATSSLHTDFKKNKRTEVESITAYVVKEARKSGLAAPGYEQRLKEIRNRWGDNA